ncbi:MAG TPA: OsmC family protein [Cytophagales bacterium]|nr:OsmC family protein [Cytophagales bacterium]
MKRSASASWNGPGKDGKGTISTQSGVLENAQYSFSTRFENGKGTNPEELIGAAHAGCYSMALSFILEGEGIKSEKIDTSAEVTIVSKDGGFEITTIHITVKGKVPGIDQTKFKEYAEKAKVGCPVSKVLKGAQISLEASLV